jgi:putative ABC transport system ATP-binding protein
VMGLFAQLNDEGTTVVIVTHEPDIGNQCERIIRLRDGLLESDRANPLTRLERSQAGSKLDHSQLEGAL